LPSITVLIVLKQEHHEKSHDSGARVYHELTRIEEIKLRYDNDKGGQRERDWVARLLYGGTDALAITSLGDLYTAISAARW
jgi:hypothetical protein